MRWREHPAKKDWRSYILFLSLPHLSLRFYFLGFWWMKDKTYPRLYL